MEKERHEFYNQTISLNQQLLQQQNEFSGKLKNLNELSKENDTIKEKLKKVKLKKILIKKIKKITFKTKNKLIIKK